MREAIAQAEVRHVPLCVLSLDFQKAFDRISHQYLFTILRSYGFSDWVERIKSMCEEAASSIQINGHVSGPIPFHNYVRQGCPMHAALCVMCGPAAPHLGRETTEYADWKASPKDSGGGLR